MTSPIAEGERTPPGASRRFSLSSIRAQLRWSLADLRLKLVYKLLRFPLFVGSLICGLGGMTTLELRLLLAAHRASRNGWLDERVASRLPEIARVSVQMASARNYGEFPRSRCLFLRAPIFGNGTLVSKGVLVVKFTATSNYFAANIDLPTLSRYFWLVIEPSWAGYADPDLLLWHCSGSPTFVQTPDARDGEFLAKLAPSFVGLPIGSSDWVDPRVFRPIDTPKRYDAIYVAGLNLTKRLHVFARAMHDARSVSGTARGALVVSSWGQASIGELRALLRWHSVSDAIEIHRDIGHSEINELLNMSRVSLMLSRKEGASRSLPESLFAGTPVILSACNIGVRRDLVNAATGTITSDRQLATTILDFGSGRFAGDPAAWARNNISPQKTIIKLAKVLRDYDGASRPTSTLWTKVNAPEMNYYDGRVAMLAPDPSEVLDLFGRGRSLRAEFIVNRLDAAFARMRSLD